MSIHLDFQGDCSFLPLASASSILPADRWSISHQEVEDNPLYRSASSMVVTGKSNCRVSASDVGFGFAIVVSPQYLAAGSV